MDLGGSQKSKTERVETDEAGEAWRCTWIEPDPRLRVGQKETQAAIEVGQQVKQRAAPGDSPPPLLSDGWGTSRGTG